MARRLAPRKPADYDSQTDGRFDNSRPPDDFTLNPSMPVNLVRPNYKEGPLVFRPLPCLDYADPTQLQIGRKAAEPGSYTHWIIRMNAASFIGMPNGQHYTFLLNHPRDKEAKNNNPYSRFFYACSDAFSSAKFGNGQKWDADWNKLMKGDSKGGASISKPKSLYFCAGAVYISGKRNYLEKSPLPYGLNAKDKLTVVQLPPSGGLGLGDLIDLRKDEFDGDEDVDLSVGFYWGDPVGTFDPTTGTVSGGIIVTLFNPKLTKIEEARAKPRDGETQGRLLRASTWDGKTIKDVQGYEVAVQRAYQLNKVVYRPDLDAEQTARVIERQQFWFDDADSGTQGLLHIAPMEQQALWVAKAYSAVPKLVRWAWSEHPEFMTEDVKAILSARVSAVIPEGEEAGSGIGDVEDSVPDEAVDEDVPPGDDAPAVPSRAGTRKDPTVRSRATTEEEEPEEELEEGEEPEPEEPEPEADAEGEEPEPEPDVEDEEPAPDEDAEGVEGDEDAEGFESELEESEEPEEAPAPRKVTKRRDDDEVDEFAPAAPKKAAAAAKPAVPAKPAAKAAPAAAKPAARRPVTPPPEDDEVPAELDDTEAVEGVPDDDVPEDEPAPKAAPKAAGKPAATKAKAAPTEDDYFEGATRQAMTAADAAKARSAPRDAAAAKPAPKPAAKPAAKPAPAAAAKPAAKPAPAAAAKPAAAKPAAAKPAAKPAARK